jgi:hypothetical protein
LRKRVAWMFAVLCALAFNAHAARRALLIGINDYTASRLGRRIAMPPDRDWVDLNGALNDVDAMRQMLVLIYGFDERDIVTLTDQRATRIAILRSVEEHLLKPAAKGDVLLFYFAGHGSQVRNSLSDEADRMDESIVPADSRTGTRDIRDKELRPLFNAMLDRGARLTVIFDNCHSGSGARGLPTGARPRGIRPDLRDAADRARYGPRPEESGALVLSAAQDFDQAWEIRDEQKQLHGAFSWALLCAMRDSTSDESASETFLRAQARLRSETPFQEPVMSGNGQARLMPLFGSRSARGADRTVVFVEKVQSDGTVVLQGGWAHGLSVGSELRVVSDRAITARLRVTAITGLGRSEARIESGRALPLAVKSGAMLEVAGWPAPPGRPLRVWAPRISGNADAIAALARRLFAEASRRGARWIVDPTESTPAYVLRRGNTGWELVGARVEQLGPDAGDAIAAVARLPAGSSLFVQFPCPSIDTAWIGMEPADRADEADYILAGRFANRKLEYAWVRPATTAFDRRKSGLPLRSDWIDANAAGGKLRDAALRLRRIHGWTLLESPPGGTSSYRLALRRARSGELARDVLIGDERYQLVLESAAPKPRQRYTYVFVIDSFGRSALLFPRGGSVENRLPFALPAPREIRLDTAFEIAPPYGVDTYYLLTTDDPLPDPWILEFDGVRTRAPDSPTALEQLLLLTGSDRRAGPLVTPSMWSVDRYVFESVAPRTAPKR